MIMKLYQKLHEIQKKVSNLTKDTKSHNYTYVSGHSVLSVIRPLMDEMGLILKQEVLSIENERQDYKTKLGDKSEILSKVMMRFTWIDVETGDSDINVFGANGQNDWEKGLGSALTYAERYFLLKYFHIATDEDDIDNPNRKTEAKEAKQQQPKIDVWMNETQFKKASVDAELAKRSLAYFDGKTVQEDGKVYGMKKEYKEQLSKIK